MPLLEWTPDMSVGVAVIDAEHQRLVRLINDLYDGVKSGKGSESLGGILDDLIDYTKAHFRHEEAFFSQTLYPDAEAHHKEHEALTKRVLEIQSKYKQDGGSATLTLETMEFLKNWLVNHIQGTDKKYTKHLNAAGIR